MGRVVYLSYPVTRGSAAVVLSIFVTRLCSRAGVYPSLLGNDWRIPYL